MPAKTSISIPERLIKNLDAMAIADSVEIGTRITRTGMMERLISAELARREAKKQRRSARASA